MESLDRLFEIIRTLRSENGCEWDRQQTPESMWKCLVEEVYELQEALAKKDLDHICEELGDALFQLVFIMEIFQERTAFSPSDVVDRVAEKMIRRHPHVYEDAVISSRTELNRQWEAIKTREQEGKKETRKSVLDSVPPGMPSLIRAFKVSKCAVKEGFEWDSLEQVISTAKDEIREFEAALANGDKEEARMEFGDILFSMVNVARFAGFHPETALTDSTAKFEGRFRLLEKELKDNGTRLKDLSREEIERLWENAKQAYDR